MNTSSLQKHIILKHCMSSNGQVAELLKMHLELLKTMIIKQNTAEGILGRMALKHTTLEHKLVNMDSKQSYLATDIREALRSAAGSSSTATAQQLPQAPQ